MAWRAMFRAAPSFGLSSLGKLRISAARALSGDFLPRNLTRASSRAASLRGAVDCGEGDGLDLGGLLGHGDGELRERTVVVNDGFGL